MTKKDLKKRLGIDSSDKHEEIEQNDEIQSFWNQRMSQTTTWFVINNISNMIFQYNALKKPYNEIHLYLNIAYMVGSILSLIGLWSTHKNPKRRKLQLVIMYYLSLRLTFRLFDFEDTKRHMEHNEWAWLLCIQVFCITISIKLISEV